MVYKRIILLLSIRVYISKTLLLKHLEILGPNTHIDINELSLISFYIHSDIDFQFKSDTLQFLAFHATFSFDGIIKLLKNLPNLHYMQLDDYTGRKKLKKAFPNVHVDNDYTDYNATWSQFMFSGQSCML